MKIDSYNISEIIDPANLDISWTDLKLIILEKRKSDNPQIEDLVKNIIKSVDASSPIDHAIIDLEIFKKIAKPLISSPRKVLLIAFGLTPQDLAWQVNYHAYEIINIRNIDLVFTHTLQELAENKAYKIDLWGILKDYSF